MLASHLQITIVLLVCKDKGERWNLKACPRAMGKLHVLLLYVIVIASSAFKYFANHPGNVLYGRRINKQTNLLFHNSSNKCNLGICPRSVTGAFDLL